METWVTVEGYKWFEVSNLGNIRHYRPYNVWERTGRGNALVTKWSYVDVRLSESDTGLIRAHVCNDDDTKTTLSLAKLVATAFVPNPMCYTSVRHIDGDKTNNSAENLMWVSSNKSLTGVVYATTSEGDIETYASQVAAARALGVHQQNISACLKGRLNTAYGRKWTSENPQGDLWLENDGL